MAEEKILDRVAKLLERANHEGTNDAEREACLNMANALMLKHQIDEAMLRTRAGATNVVREPIQTQMDFIPPDTPYDEVLYAQVALPLARLAGIRMIQSKNSYVSILFLFGYPDDIEYFRMLWASTYLSYSNYLYPKWNATKSLDENVYIMVNAGYKWQTIFQYGQRAGAVDFAWPDGGRLKRAYRRQVVKEGEEVRAHTSRHAAYRESYAMAFANAIQGRVHRMLDYRESQVSKTVGAAVALRSDFDRINTMFESFLSGQQLTKVAYRPKHHEERSGQLAGSAAGNSTDLSGGRGHLKEEQRGIEG